MKNELSIRFLELKSQVDLANRLHPTKLNGRELSLGGSQSKGYKINLVTGKDRLILGTVAYGNFKEIENAINVFCRTLQLV